MSNQAKIYVEKVECKLCHKELTEASFNRHLARHFDPRSRLCSKWYKKYFTSDQGICVCIFCDKAIYPDVPTASYEYEQHLAQHGVSATFKGNK